uniref:Uncharacterized protein n=1 Tax=Caldicellulosiruptor owensensis TaxID=55205 RepID=A0A7C5Z7E2_9FIRM
MIYIARDFSVTNLQNFVVHVVAKNRDDAADFIRSYGYNRYGTIRRYKNQEITHRDLIVVKNGDNYTFCFIWPGWAAINLP